METWGGWCAGRRRDETAGQAWGRRGGAGGAGGSAGGAGDSGWAHHCPASSQVP